MQRCDILVGEGGGWGTEGGEEKGGFCVEGALRRQPTLPTSPSPHQAAHGQTHPSPVQGSCATGGQD